MNMSTINSVEEDEATVESILWAIFSGDDEDENFVIKTTEDQAKGFYLPNIPKGFIDRVL